ncbi:MAG: DUF5597 domain-containing protein [Muribaculum sp.]|nr:DUF5597 domain-containing protein [Muribaculum sp.]
MLRFTLFILLNTFILTLNAESRLDRQGNAIRLIVDGSPYIIVGGETGNSMASSPQDVKESIEKAKAHGYNTILIPVTWELIEPRKGEFDFSSVDEIISQASDEGLKVVPLWFGAWKNSMSCYAPEWFKCDTKTYPRAYTSTGKPLEIASAFSPNVYEADAAAFFALLQHIKQVDNDGSVIMLQIENEIGMLEDARDHSALADEVYNKGVPAQLINHLKNNKESLHPVLLSKWQEAGMKQSGSWTEMFGDDIYTDEIFMAYNYATYVEGLSQIAHSVFPDMPLYVNAALNSRGRKPGEYPSAGPLDHLKDIWHAGAPSLTLLAIDLYDDGFTSWMRKYSLPDNQLFVSEIKATPANSVQAFYVVGEHGAIGLCPFAYNLRAVGDYSYQKQGNEKLISLTPIIAKHLGKGTMHGFYLDADSVSRTIENDGVSIKTSHYFTLPWDPRAKDQAQWRPMGGLIIQLTPEEYIIAGSGIVTTFEPSGASSSVSPITGEDGFALSGNDNLNVSTYISKPIQRTKIPRIGLASVNEVSVNPDGTLNRIRTLNGDETHQGRHVRIGVDEFKILHVKIYHY